MNASCPAGMAGPVMSASTFCPEDLNCRCGIAPASASCIAKPSPCTESRFSVSTTEFGYTQISSVNALAPVSPAGEGILTAALPPRPSEDERDAGKVCPACIHPEKTAMSGASPTRLPEIVCVPVHCVASVEEAMHKDCVGLVVR